MRRTGWMVGIAVLGMAAAGLVAVLPFRRREIVKVVFSGTGDHPICNGLEGGFRCAMEERGRRAGPFRVQSAFRRGGFTMDSVPAEDVDIHDDPQVLGVVSVTDLYQIGITNGVYCVECRPNAYRSGELGPGQACILPPLEDQAACAARWCRKLGCRRVALARTIGDSRLDALADAFRAEAKPPGMACEDVFLGSDGPAEAAKLALRFKPDVVFYFEEQAPHHNILFEELRKAGYPGIAMILDMGAGPTELLGTVLEETRIVSPWVPPPADFVQAYSKVIPGPPPDGFAYAGYRAALQVLDALDRVESRDREAVQRAGRTGWPERPECAGYLFRGGRFEFVELLK